MTDVHFHERNEFGATQTLDRGVIQRTEMTTITNTANLEATEMAAFEKGRMQGEMEAIRRMEAEQGAMQLKQFPAEHSVAATVQKPDIVEINRLTWLQRVSWLTGEGALLASIVLTIVWIELYRGSFAWSNDTGSVGNIGMWNAHLLSFVLGIFFLANAITMYRVLPLNLSPMINRAIYVFNYCCAMTCFSVTFAARVNTPPEATFWAVDDWCYALAFSVVGLHFIYSMIRTFMVRSRPVDYETWSETNNKVTLDTPEQRRDHSTFNHAGRTVYTPAPVSLARVSKNIPAASANVGAQVPVAPANAPRWAENPNTHAEDYFLLPRAKWATVGFFSIGAVFLMTLAAVQHNLAAGTQNWSQNNVENPPRFMNERGAEAAILGALSLLLLAGLIFISYAAMPPRTTLVKNGILTDANRRTSISHNAETVNERHIV